MTSDSTLKDTMRSPRKPTTYWDYIKLDELLALQNGIADTDAELKNDEVLFITIHQIDELWFKLILRELVTVRELFSREHVPEQSLSSAVRGLRRVEQLFGHVANHFALMESMTTRDYLAFRDKLSPASGFQSSQLREIEILLGLKDENRIPLGHDGDYLKALKNADGSSSLAYNRVRARLDEGAPTLADAVDEWLYRTPICGSTPNSKGDDEVVLRFCEDYLAQMAAEVKRAKSFSFHEGLTEADVERLNTRYEKSLAGARRFLLAEEAEPEEQSRRRRIRAAIVFVESYRELPLLAWPREVIDAMVSLEQASVIFRQRHARMVERIIGRRIGTGGSAGVDYLDSTALSYRVFPDLWAVRTLLIREASLPDLDTPGYYDLATDTR